MFVNDVVSVIRTLWTGRFLFLVPGGLLMLALPSWGADSVNLTLNYTVIQGTCTVDVQTASGNTLNFGNVNYAWKSTDDWPQINLQPFSVKLSQCSGSPSASTQPVLTISGATDSLSKNDTNKAFMFVDETTSQAKGFGFVIFNTSDSPKTSNAVADINSSKGDTRGYIAIPGKGKNTAITSDTVVSLSAAVTCGSTCSDNGKINPAMRAGPLTGAVTFSFVYH